MERINLNFHGQEIPNNEQAHIKAILGYHLGDGPSDTSLCCCISSEKEGFAANLQIHSAGGHVFIHRESQSLEKLMEYIYDSMKRSFADWHKNKKLFSKSHPMTQNPCRGASHKSLPCPLRSFAKAPS